MISAQDLLKKVQPHFAKCPSQIVADQLIMEVAPSDLLKTCKILRDNADFKFEQLIDLCGVDYLHYGVSEWATDTATSEGFSRGVEADSFIAVDKPQFPARFAVVYQLLSVSLNQRIRLRTFVSGEPLAVPTVTGIWPSAEWYEREAFDLYGILFEDHPDLRRILTDYGFVGYPFRKDFPLIGQVEMRYDATMQRCVYEPVTIEPRTLVPKVIQNAEPK